MLLFSIGVLFSILWLAEIVQAILAGSVPSALAETGLWVNPVHVLDLAFLLPGMIATALLLRKEAFAGHLIAVPLLVFPAAMGLGIIASFALSALRGLPYSLPAGAMVGAIVILGTLVAGLFLNGARSA